MPVKLYLQVAAFIDFFALASAIANSEAARMDDQSKAFLFDREAWAILN